jgi:hypothetical protein
MKKIFLNYLPLSLLFTFMIACNPESVLDNTDDSSSSTDDSEDTEVVQTEDSSDYTWTASSNTITLNGTSIATTSSTVTISGTTATITEGGNYTVTGTLNSGQLIVDAPNEIVKIQLNNSVVTNTTSSPFYIKKAAKVILFLATGTTNSFSDAASYSNTDEPNACISSNSYLSVTGDGTLTVTGKYADAISSDDQVVIKSGIINVTAVDDGIRGKDYLVIHGGTISATSTSGHALKSDNTDSGLGYVTIDGGTLKLASSSGKGIKAVNKFTQDAGNITITKSYEGVESFSVVINGGSLDITATNDGINTTAGTVNGGTESNDGSSLVVTGGTLIATTSAGDAIDSNGNITVSGGTIIANGPSSGAEEAVDFNGTFTMNGGIFIGAGSNSNMTKAMSTSSSQSNMYVTSKTQISSSTLINIRIGTTDVITFKPKFGGYKFLFSAPTMTKGVAYSIFTDGSYSSTTNTSGLYTGGTYTAGTSKTTGTLSSSNSVNTISF